jgi:hypothetical protein
VFRTKRYKVRQQWSSKKISHVLPCNVKLLEEKPLATSESLLEYIYFILFTQIFRRLMHCLQLSVILRTLIKLSRVVGKNTMVHFMPYDMTSQCKMTSLCIMFRPKLKYCLFPLSYSTIWPMSWWVGKILFFPSITKIADKKSFLCNVFN